MHSTVSTIAQDLRPLLAIVGYLPLFANKDQTKVSNHNKQEKHFEGLFYEEKKKQKK